MRRMAIGLVALLTFIILLTVSCSSNSSVTLPDNPVKAAEKTSTSHRLMGLWQFKADPEAQTLEYCELRMPEMHVNVLPFLEPPPLLYLTLEGEIEFDIPNNTLTVDIGLTHPFTGLNEFAGFDVKGIVISRADLLGSYPTRDLTMPGSTTLQLINADGYTRMWNPVDFPYDAASEIFTYKDGMLGAPNSFGNYNAQLNGFKYFCDSLDPGDKVSDMDFAQRGLFTPGAKNIRTYEIRQPQGLVFNYAVDASWEFPTGGAPWTIPDDYPITANCPEAYFVDYSTDGLMFSEDGGSSMQITIEVWDHQPGSIQSVFVESKALYTEVAPNPPARWFATYESSTVNSDIYTVHVDNKNNVSAGVYPAVIGVEDVVVDQFNNINDPPDTFYTAWRLFNVTVTQKPGVSVTLEEDALVKGGPYFTAQVDHVYDMINYATPPAWIVDYTDSDGPWQFSYAYNDIVTLSSLPITSAEVSGFVGQYPSEVDHFYKAAFDNFGGPAPLQPYLGEEHDFTYDNTRNVYGVTEASLLGGTYTFTDSAGTVTPMKFTYPYYYGTDFTTIGCEYVLPPPPIPIEVLEIEWRVRGLGEGDVTLVDGGATYTALLMRHDIIIELSNIDFAWIIMYEWLHDTGVPLAYIIAGESPGHMNNFFHDSGIIYGNCTYMVHQGY